MRKHVALKANKRTMYGYASKILWYDSSFEGYWNQPKRFASVDLEVDAFEWNFSDPRTPHCGRVDLWCAQGPGLSLEDIAISAVGNRTKPLNPWGFAGKNISVWVARVQKLMQLGQPIFLALFPPFLVERCRKPSKGSSSSLPSEDPCHVLKIDRLRLSTYNSFCSDRGSLIAMPPPPKRNKRTGPKSYRTRGETKDARDAFGYVDGMAQNC